MIDRSSIPKPLTMFVSLFSGSDIAYHLVKDKEAVLGVGK